MQTDIERQDPMREMLTLRNRLDSLFDNMTWWPRNGWTTSLPEFPALNVYEKNGNVCIDAQLPGVKPEDIEVTRSGQMLTIKGQSKAKEEVKDEDYYRREMRYGSFARTVALPETVDLDKPQAVFEHGVLSISFPKRAETPASRIEIKLPEHQPA